METAKIKTAIDVIKNISFITSSTNEGNKNTNPTIEAIPFIYGSWH